MSKLVVIENTVVRQDAFGRYCLNDLHRAAGELEKDRPKYWLANDIAKRHYFDNSQLYFFAAYHGIRCNRF